MHKNVERPLLIARLFIALGRLTRDLDRLQVVFQINDLLTALRTDADEAAVVDDFASSELGRVALRGRPRLRLSMAEMGALPAESLGGSWARFMTARGLSPESIPERDGASALAYITAHFYESHDLWHVLSGFDTDAAGEVGVQAMLLAQTRTYLPLFVNAAVFINTAFYAYEERTKRMDALARGWLLGKSAKSLVVVDWRPHLGRPLVDVQREFGLLPA